jgi:2,3-dihydroxybenzoate decarboxylase
MTGKIAWEEHFALSDTANDSEQYAVSGGWPALKFRLAECGTLRLSEMDRHGVEISVLSLNSPAIQAIRSRTAAVHTARLANDALADTVSKHPDRFRGLAALPMQDPRAAQVELTRAIQELGFVGALVNGFAEDDDQILYYDGAEYEEFWAEVERLGVPFYLHPRDPLPRRAPIYDGHPWLMGSAWAFGVETATHALRLMASGVFDRHPRLVILLGHLGEGLPSAIWRIDHRLRKSPRGIPARKPMIDYLRSNFYVTTSGNFHTPVLTDAIRKLGCDRVLFAVDYPFEETSDAAAWFDAAEVSENDRVKIGRTNALRLLRL